MASDWITITEEEALGGGNQLETVSQEEALGGENQWETVSEEEALGSVGQEKHGFISGLIEKPYKFLPLYGSMIGTTRKLSTAAAAKRLEAANVDPD